MQDIRREIEALRHELANGGRRANEDLDLGVRAVSRDRTQTSESHAYATLLGPFTLVLTDMGREDPVAVGRSAAVGEVCRYLIAHPDQVIPREVLMELLWPGEEPQLTGHRLQVAISQLRKLLLPVSGRAAATDSEGGGVPRFVSGGYMIDRSLVRTDTALFEGKFRRGRDALDKGRDRDASEAFAEALTLYKGNFLAEYPYADWAAPIRRKYAQMRVRTLDALACQALRLGTLDRSLEYADEMVRADSLNERGHRHVMRALYGSGQRALAVQQYFDCKRVLQSELGIAPSQLTDLLHAAIIKDTALPSETGDIDRNLGKIRVY